MNARNEERFSELAMKVIARQSTDAERAELETLLASDPRLQVEYRRLQGHVRLAKELAPLAVATEATQGELPAYARGRLQTKVRETLGRPRAELDEPARTEVGLLLRWRWWLGLAMATAVAAIIAIPALLQRDRPVIELAMLDLAGATRGTEDQSLRLPKETWGGAAVQQFASAAELKAWEAAWPQGSRGLVVKVIYDRSAGEIRVLGHGRAGVFTNSFPAEPDLGAAIGKAKAYLDQQTPPRGEH